MASEAGQSAFLANYREKFKCSFTELGKEKKPPTGEAVGLLLREPRCAAERSRQDTPRRTAESFPGPPRARLVLPCPRRGQTRGSPRFVLCAVSYVANASIRFPASGGGERGGHGDSGKPPRKTRMHHRAALAEPRRPEAGTRGPRRGPERAGSQAGGALSPNRVPAGSEQPCARLINVQVVKPLTKTWIKIHETECCIQMSTEEPGREGTRAACTPHGPVLAGPQHWEGPHPRREPPMAPRSRRNPAWFLPHFL